MVPILIGVPSTGWLAKTSDKAISIELTHKTNGTMQVSDNKVVSIRYRMKNSRGEVLENTLDGTPIHYLHGVGSILPALETDLAGLKAGDERTVFISKVEGGGQLDDDFYLEVVIDGVRSATEEEMRIGSPSRKDCGPGCNC